MDKSDLATSRQARSSAIPDEDEVELLAGKRVPLVKVRPASEQWSEARRQRSGGSSRDLGPINEQSVPGKYSVAEVAAAGSVDQKNPHPTSASSLLRKITILRPQVSPIFRNRSARKALGKYNEIGNDYDVDSVPVDLSSLTGMGFEMTMGSSGTNTEYLGDEETAYISPRETSTRLGSDTSTRGSNSRAPKIGDGLVVGAELKFDPSKAVPDRAKSSRRQDDTDNVQRTKTVRKVGQNLAQEKQTIVAVKEKLDDSEGIDISSLEGSRLSYRMSSQALDETPGMSPNRAQTTALSYFFPEDPDIPNWRPFSMSTWYISLLIAISLGLAIFQEWLCQHSMRLAKQTPPRGILEYDEVAKVPLWSFFAWKCEMCSNVASLAC